MKVWLIVLCFVAMSYSLLLAIDCSDSVYTQQEMVIRGNRYKLYWMLNNSLDTLKYYGEHDTLIFDLKNEVISGGYVDQEKLMWLIIKLITATNQY